MKATGPHELPIIFTAESVRAILAGAKSQTRRIIKELPDLVSEAPDDVQVDFHDGAWKAWSMEYPEHGHIVLRPRFGVGDRLWVKEAWRTEVDNGICGITLSADFSFHPIEDTAEATAAWEKAHASKRIACEWRSPLYMPRWASRIVREVTEVRVQRVQAITEEDARAEGFESDADQLKALSHLRGSDAARAVPSRLRSARDQFHDAWDSINGRKAPWSSNPSVFAYTFRRIDK